MKPFFTAIMSFILFNLLAQAPITVADGSFKVTGISEENFYFGFAEGDKISFTLEEEKGKEIREIEVIELPSSSRFVEFKSSKIKKILTIPTTGIYQFRINNGALGGRFCRYQITRTPASQETDNFNTAVYWQIHNDTTWTDKTESYLTRDEYVAKELVASSKFYVNSGSNAILKGGKSRIVIPVNLPANTVKWYYTFSASRSEEEIAGVQQSIGLAGQLSKLIDQTGTLEFGIEMLTQPPGADYCDIYLLDHANSRLFESKQEYQYFTNGTRENLKSGTIELSFGAGAQYYIGIKNPDTMNGVHVMFEAVAIVHEQEYAERMVSVPSVNTYQTPYLKN